MVEAVCSSLLVEPVCPSLEVEPVCPSLVIDAVCPSLVVEPVSLLVVLDCKECWKLQDGIAVVDQERQQAVKAVC